MIRVSLQTIKDLQISIDDSRIPVEGRSLMVRRFCNEHGSRVSPPADTAEDEGHWTKVDTDHLLTISTDMARLSNYLVERVVAAS